MSLSMAGDYSCTYSFLFTVDCSGHFTCTVTNGGDGSNTYGMLFCTKCLQLILASWYTVKAHA